MITELVAGIFPVIEINLSRPSPKDGDPMFLLYALAATGGYGQLICTRLLVEWNASDTQIVVPEDIANLPILRLKPQGLPNNIGVHGRETLPKEPFETPFTLLKIEGHQTKISGFHKGGLVVAA